MTSRKIKYPRTLHLPFTEHVTTDDKILSNTDVFENKEVVVTEKMDGENTSLYSHGLHARSLETRDHPSRHRIKALHGSIKSIIPEGWRICGENVYAKHSIYYTNLTSYFYVFAIVNDQNQWLGWDEMVKLVKDWGLEVVPVLYRGMWDEKEVKKCYTGRSVFGGEQEGYTVRVADSFHYDDFQNNLAKWVRKNHVQTDDHWLSKPVVPNKLGENNV